MDYVFIMLLCMGGVFASLLAMQYALAISDYLLIKLDRLVQRARVCIKRHRDKKRK